MKQLLVLSGKGGTGKTTVAGAFIALSGARAFADCDVDAPNLHLLYGRGKPISRPYYGIKKAFIDKDKCIMCGECEEKCRFGAITNKNGFEVDGFSCEGCGVCELVCPAGAVGLSDSVSGELNLYKNKDYLFSAARLNMGSGASGKLVTEVKKQMEKHMPETDLTVIDGSPGIGCPVIASVSGVDMALMVAEPTLSGISDLKRVVKTALILGARVAVCVNKFDINIKNTREIFNFCQDSDIPFTGVIPFDSLVGEAVNQGRNITEIKSKAGDAIKRVYEKTMRALYS